MLPILIKCSTGPDPTPPKAFWGHGCPDCPECCTSQVGWIAKFFRVPKGTMSMWCPCSILKPAAILGEPVLLRAQTSPARPQSSGEPGLQSVEPPIWLLRECLTRERMRSHSVSAQEPTHRRTPLRHADLVQNLRAEKVRKRSPDCTLTPRQI